MFVEGDLGWVYIYLYSLKESSRQQKGANTLQGGGADGIEEWAVPF